MPAMNKTLNREIKDGITTINLQQYKRLFMQVLIPVVAAIAASILVQRESFTFSLFVIQTLAIPIMGVLAVLAFVHAYYQRKRLQKINGMEDFEEKGAAYQRLYTFRVLWYLFSSYTSCLLYVLAMHKLFLLFALFDLLQLIFNYPNRNIFKRELQNEDIIFY